MTGNKSSHHTIFHLGALVLVLLLQNCAKAESPEPATNEPQTTSAWMAPTEASAHLNPIPYTVESVTKGKNIFARYCIACHGYWGEGDGVTGLMLNNRPANLLMLAGHETPGSFAWKITEGNGEMPSFRDLLSEEDIWHTVNFIESLENETGTSGRTVVMKRCANCHGMAGAAIIEGWPDLPQMTLEEIEAKLFGHRAKLIDDSTMSKVTFDLTDEEIHEAAIYYSSLKLEKVGEQE